MFARILPQRGQITGDFVLCAEKIIIIFTKKHTSLVSVKNSYVPIT